MICSGRLNGVVGVSNLAEPMPYRHNRHRCRSDEVLRKGTRRKLGVAAFSNAWPVVPASGVSVKSTRAGGSPAPMSGTSMATRTSHASRHFWPEHINTSPVGAFKAVGPPSGVRHVYNVELLDGSPPRRSVSA